MNTDLLHLYLEHSPLALIAWDDQVRFVRWSPKAEQLFGWSADDVLGKTMADIDFVVPEDVARVDEVVEKLLSGRTTWNTGENRNRTKDGRILRVRWFNVFCETAEFCGFISLAEDVTSIADVRRSARENRERLRSLFDDNPDVIVTCDPDGVVSAANAAARRMFARREGVVGTPLLDLVPPDAMPDTRAGFNRALSGMASGFDAAIVARGGIVPTHTTMIPIRLRNKPVGVHVHVRDRRAEIERERENAQHAARIRELYLAAALANRSADGQISATLEAGCRILNAGSGAVYACEDDAFVATFGEPPSLAVARTVAGTPELTSDDDGGAIGTPIVIGSAPYGSLLFTSPGTCAFDPVDRDLVQLMAELIGSAIERGRSHAKLETLAYTDTTTLLPNRAWLIERLECSIDDARRDGKQVAVLFLDLDRFKDINDTLGHEVGDRLLQIVGKRLQRAVRECDSVARMGGDEFAVIACGPADTSTLATLADRIIAAIEAPIHLDDTEHYITASVGLASFPGDGGDADTLVKHADVAMYRAKERGRNTYQFFTPALTAAIHTRLAQEKEMRRALEQYEFVVHYQPQHDVVSGDIVSVEALVRWDHPRRGLVFPGTFIPNAEFSGLIVALGDYVLETACRDIATLRRSLAPDLFVAVNLSARQFLQQHLADKVRDVLSISGLDPKALELEITESVAMNDAEISVDIMRELGDTGILLSVDDFGTGYSSLGYLRRFPIDSLKIDRSFVTDIATEPDDATIVKGVIAMAHALDLEVVAEGVENAEQLAFLREQRCDRVQGFYYSKAVSRPELEAYIARHRTATPARVLG